MKEEEFKKEFIKNEKEYFAKNFSERPFHEAIYNSSRKAIIMLLQAQISFFFLKDSLNVLKKEKDFFETLKNEDKEILNNMIEFIEYIISQIEEILQPILKALS